MDLEEGARWGPDGIKKEKRMGVPIFPQGVEQELRCPCGVCFFFHLLFSPPGDQLFLARCGVLS